MKNKESPLATVLAALLVIIGFVGVLAVFALLGGLITWAVWNLIAVPVFHALGWAAFPKISFWLAIGINVLWGIVTRPFRRTSTVQAA